MADGDSRAYEGMKEKWRNDAAETQPIPYLAFAEIKPQLTGNYLVKGLLGCGAMSVLYGDSNTCKTFLALDLGLHIALGWDWFGRKVKQAGVLYIAGEGGHGVQNRIAAFRKQHNITWDVPFALIPTALDLRSDSADTDRLIATIAEIASRFEHPIGLVTVDTLSRALAGGNESGSDDMGAYVQNIDRIRAATAAHLLSVHHTGKDHAKGARGHSLLRAATDTEIEVTRSEKTAPSVSRVTKQRDLPTDGAPIAFRLESVELGKDEDQDVVSSCVIVPCSNEEARALRKTPIRGQAWIALNALRQCIEEAGEAPPASNHVPINVRAVTEERWERYCAKVLTPTTNKSDSRKKAFQRAVAKLHESGAVGKWDPWVWVSS